MSGPFASELLTIIDNNRERPLLFANARIITGDSLIGDVTRGDVLLGGHRVVGIGPGLLTAAGDDGAVVIDCDGYVIVPTLVDAAALGGLRLGSYRSRTSIAPGNLATFAILPDSPDASSDDTLRRLLDAPQSAHAVVANGRVALWDGHPVSLPSTDVPDEQRDRTTHLSVDHLGTWIDESDFVHQHLTEDGRYNETRGGREYAYQGMFWIDGNRIDYLDDLGFWAFGEFDGDTLQHAGYTFHRA